MARALRVDVAMTYGPLTSKPIPLRKGEQIIPPEEGFPFLEHAERVPFDFRATQLQPENAWWMAELSRLAYTVPKRAQRELARAGLPGFYSKSAGSTQLFVAHNDDFSVLAFRGTEIKRFNAIEDIWTDVRAEQAPWPQNARVHRGFFDALASVWHGGDGLAAYLEALRNERPSRPLFITGHSLGAGLATLTAARLGLHVKALYTFGSPRVGDTAFVRSFAVPNYRYVHNNDWVPHLPTPTLLPVRGLPSYQHLSRLVYVADDSRVYEQPRLGQQLVLGVRGAVAYQLERFQGLFSTADHHLSRVSPRLSIPFDMFADHAIVLYALHLWNHLVATQNELQGESHADRLPSRGYLRRFASRGLR